VLSRRQKKKCNNSSSTTTIFLVAPPRPCSPTSLMRGPGSHQPAEQNGQRQVPAGRWSDTYTTPSAPNAFSTTARPAVARWDWKIGTPLKIVCFIGFIKIDKISWKLSDKLNEFLVNRPVLLIYLGKTDPVDFGASRGKKNLKKSIKIIYIIVTGLLTL
jgi:hypothetical protein